MYEPDPAPRQVRARGEPSPTRMSTADSTSRYPTPLLLPLIEAAADVLKSLEAVDVPANCARCTASTGGACSPGRRPASSRRALLTDAAFREQVVEQFLARSEVEGDARRVERGRRGHERGRRRDPRRSRVRTRLRCGRRDRMDARSASASRSCSTVRRVRPATRRTRGQELGPGARRARRSASPRRRRHGWRPRPRPRGPSTSCSASAARRRSREDDAMAAAAVARAAGRRAAHRARSGPRRGRGAAAPRDALGAARACARGGPAPRPGRQPRPPGQGREPGVAARWPATSGRSPTRSPRPASSRSRSTRCSAGSRKRPTTRPGPKSSRSPGSAQPAPIKRAAPRLPPGVLADSPPGVEAMLATPDVVLVVDGYNVAHVAWARRHAGRPAGAARHRGDRADAPARLRDRARVRRRRERTARPLRRGGVRVLFSDAGEEADEVVVREVEARSKRVPVVVASSDAWVREHAPARAPSSSAPPRS